MKRNILTIVLFIGWSIIVGCSSDKLSFEEHLSKGEDYYNDGKFDKAISHYQKALKINSTSEKAHYALGLSYYGKWRLSFESARKKYWEDVVNNPHRIPKSSAINYEVYGENRNALELAFKNFQYALKINPENWELRYFIATNYLNSGFYDDAIEEYEKVININNKYSNAYSGQGTAYYRKGLYKMAIEKYKKAADLDQNSPYFIYELGLAYLKNND